VNVSSRPPDGANAPQSPRRAGEASLRGLPEARFFLRCSVEHAEPLVVRHVTQPAVALLITRGEEFLSRPHAERARSEADERDPVAVFLGDLAHHLADQPGAEPVLCGKRLVEAAALVGQDRTDRERARRHPPSCSRGRRGSASTVSSAQVRTSSENLVQAPSDGQLREGELKCGREDSSRQADDAESGRTLRHNGLRVEWGLCLCWHKYWPRRGRLRYTSRNYDADEVR